MALGISFIPNPQQQQQQPGSQSQPLQQALQMLSLRVPRFGSAGALMPPLQTRPPGSPLGPMPGTPEFEELMRRLMGGYGYAGPGQGGGGSAPNPTVAYPAPMKPDPDGGVVVPDPNGPKVPPVVLPPNVPPPATAPPGQWWPKHPGGGIFKTFDMAPDVKQY